MEERYLAKWHVKLTEKVKLGLIIAEIETDKATKRIELVCEHIVSALFFARKRCAKNNSVIAELYCEVAVGPKAVAARHELKAARSVLRARHLCLNPCCRQRPRLLQDWYRPPPKWV